MVPHTLNIVVCRLSVCQGPGRFGDSQGMTQMVQHMENRQTFRQKWPLFTPLCNAMTFS